LTFSRNIFTPREDTNKLVSNFSANRVVRKHGASRARRSEEHVAWSLKVGNGGLSSSSARMAILCTTISGRDTRVHAAILKPAKIYEEDHLLNITSRSER
jgi:hypothetical protein